MPYIHFFFRAFFRVVAVLDTMLVLSFCGTYFAVSCFALSVPLSTDSVFQRSTDSNTIRTFGKKNTQVFSNRDREIERLNYIQQLQELELRRHDVIRNSLLIGLVLLILIVAILANRYRLKKRITADLIKKNQDFSYANNEVMRQQRILEDQAAEIELANSELHEYNLQLRTLNAEVELRIAELETIDTIVQSINRNMQFSALLQNLLDQGRKLLPTVEKGSVLALDHATNTFRFQAFFGFDPHDFENIELNKQEIERRYLHHDSMVSGVYVMTDFPSTTSEGKKFTVKPPECSMVMTIPIGNTTEGLVFFDVYTSGYRFTEADKKRCQRLRQHIITAFAQARALESLQDAAERLTTQNILLQELNQEKNEFLGIAAHDLKNPLAQIMISAGKISHFYDRMSKEDVVRSMGYIETTTRRMSDIITNLLEINAIESNHYALNQTDNCIVNISTLVQSIAEEMRSSAMAKNIVLQYTAPAEVLTVRADALALRSVVENLCSNAVKYSPLATTVTVSLQNSEGTIKFTVRDEGPGISKEEQKLLFSKFVRLSAKPTGGESSTGLGLYIVKKLVEVMNGEVWCESEAGKGATFIVKLPQAVE
jgi:signal transduction histidine kinase